MYPTMAAAAGPPPTVSAIISPKEQFEHFHWPALLPEHDDEPTSVYNSPENRPIVVDSRRVSTLLLQTATEVTSTATDAYAQGYLSDEEDLSPVENSDNDACSIASYDFSEDGSSTGSEVSFGQASTVAQATLVVIKAVRPRPTLIQMSSTRPSRSQTVGSAASSSHNTSARESSTSRSSSSSYTSASSPPRTADSSSRRVSVDFSHISPPAKSPRRLSRMMLGNSHRNTFHSASPPMFATEEMPPLPQRQAPAMSVSIPESRPFERHHSFLQKDPFASPVDNPANMPSKTKRLHKLSKSISKHFGKAVAAGTSPMLHSAQSTDNLSTGTPSTPTSRKPFPRLRPRRSISDRSEQQLSMYEPLTAGRNAYQRATTAPLSMYVDDDEAAMHQWIAQATAGVAPPPVPVRRRESVILLS